MHTIFGLLVIVLANTWAHPSTSASILTDFPETMVTEVPIGSFTEDNVTVTTTVVTEGLKLVKSVKTQSSRWCGVGSYGMEYQLRCRPRHLTIAQNYVHIPFLRATS
ncbi:hypothetical protein TNCV_3064101 [Trichonephila clavipes]|nr:hypothetical protein TNCV_3064101 [Trichonephila clavipes]